VPPRAAPPGGPGGGPGGGGTIPGHGPARPPIPAPPGTTPPYTELWQEPQLPGGARRGKAYPGKPDLFVDPSRSGRATAKQPVVEKLSTQDYQFVRAIGGDSKGLNVGFILRDPNNPARLWLFKPAELESGMLFGPDVGIAQNERWRRAAASA